MELNKKRNSRKDEIIDFLRIQKANTREAKATFASKTRE